MSCTSRLLVPRCDSRHGRLLLVLSPHSLSLRGLSSRPRISGGLRESYRLLQLPDEGDSSPAQVKESYLRLAKLYHPDSGAATADPALFARLEEAYRAVLAHQSKIERADGEREPDEEDKSKGVSLAHRHYLSYEGLGLGTPSQRQRQYRQIRADRASDQVLNYRQREHERAAASEGALQERDVRQRSRKIKITQAVERLVEDLIQESMARGDFRNLSGAGKPLSKFQHNPYADPMTHNLNRILLDNGYQPPWVATQRRIRETAAEVRRKLLEGRAGLGHPMSPGESRRWEELCAWAGAELAKLNKTVDDYNLIVPLISMQMVHFSLAREAERAARGAWQRRQEQQGEREREREERRREEEETRLKSGRRGLVSWMQSFFR